LRYCKALRASTCTIRPKSPTNRNSIRFLRTRMDSQDGTLASAVSQELWTRMATICSHMLEKPQLSSPVMLPTMDKSHLTNSRKIWLKIMQLKELIRTQRTQERSQLLLETSIWQRPREEDSLPRLYAPTSANVEPTPMLT